MMHEAIGRRTGSSVHHERGARKHGELTAQKALSASWPVDALQWFKGHSKTKNAMGLGFSWYTKVKVYMPCYVANILGIGYKDRASGYWDCKVIGKHNRASRHSLFIQGNANGSPYPSASVNGTVKAASPSSVNAALSVFDPLSDSVFVDPNVASFVSASSADAAFWICPTNGGGATLHRRPYFL